MRKLIQFLLITAALVRRHPVIAANEEAPPVVAANESLSAANFTVRDNGSLFVPYGAFPVSIMLDAKDAARARAAGHAVGANGMVTALQIVDEQAALSMANELNSISGRLSRLFRGAPVYVGHPYHPNPELRDTDKRARGWGKSIEIANEEGGFRFIVAYNELGSAEVNDAQFAYHSPQWDMELLPIVKGQPLRCRPVRLQSFGLTNQPNIPVPAIVAANEADAGGDESRETETEDEPSMNLLDKIKALLKKAGLTSEADTDEAVEGAIGNLISNLAWSRERKAADENELKKLQAVAGANEGDTRTREELLEVVITAANERQQVQAQLTAANEARTAAEERLTAANEAAATARRERLNLAMTGLISEGRLTLAEANAETTRLLTAANEAEVTTALEELGKRTPKTGERLSGNLAGARKTIIGANEGQIRMRQREEAVQAVLAEITRGRAQQPEDHQRAWSIARQRNPSLFSY
jgi:hypothetical protein